MLFSHEAQKIDGETVFSIYKKRCFAGSWHETSCTGQAKVSSKDHRRKKGTP